MAAGDKFAGRERLSKGSGKNCMEKTVAAAISINIKEYIRTTGKISCSGNDGNCVLFLDQSEACARKSSWNKKNETS